MQLEDDARRLEAWLGKGFGAGMAWMERNFDLRIDPRKLVPGAKSVITLLLNYYPKQQQQPGAPLIAKYAWGRDYHDVIRAKLNELLAFIRSNIGDVDGRGFVDSAPVLERAWAVRTGLGWVGKNGNLLTKHSGSFFLSPRSLPISILSPMLLLPPITAAPVPRCIDACPTEAIISPTVIDANKCISYLTIELKDALMPKGFEQRQDNWIFGCDICQDVCPWNRFSKATKESDFTPAPEVLNLAKGEWGMMTEEAFRKIFKGSPIKRAKWSGVMRNLNAIK